MTHREGSKDEDHVVAACGLMLSEFAVVIQQCSQHLICKIPVVFCGSGRCS